MTNKSNIEQKEYEVLVMELRKELPNIVLPSMGMLDEVKNIDINGKDFVISDDSIKEV